MTYHAASTSGWFAQRNLEDDSYGFWRRDDSQVHGALVFDGLQTASRLPVLHFRRDACLVTLPWLQAALWEDIVAGYLDISSDVSNM